MADMRNPRRQSRAGNTVAMAAAGNGGGINAIAAAIGETDTVLGGDGINARPAAAAAVTVLGGGGINARAAAAGFSQAIGHLIAVDGRVAALHGHRLFYRRSSDSSPPYRPHRAGFHYR